ncbi:universal stress protein UspA [Halalkalibacillus sediminis]|uniref:Universal stress protein n=1 Tax=Halalkalibacillus sediminis TaxID=2018042 RepID=A0A2I0QTE1_9BACI|nr:universal stress protein [Halalkalibacillus sediminis]PKR77596.1 universal stress protein UspA [Halalkalibacillus sediminis]
MEQYQPYQHILVAFDGSEPAKNAVQKAVIMANGLGAKLTIATIIDSDQMDLLIVGGYKNAVSEAESKARARLGELLEELTIPAGLNFETTVRLGVPKHMIAKKLPDELGVDLIYCGATGTNALERWFLGSVSHHVLHQSERDVLLIR